MLIDDSLRFFVKHLQSRAVVLRGRWGVGKTFYWREQIVKEFFAHANLRREDRGYSYVSLFGIESVQQIKNALAYSYAENEQPSWWRIGWQWIGKNLRRLGRFLGRAVADEVSVSANGIGAKVKLTSLLNDFAFLSIKRALICIDDLERRNAKLSIGDVLGLVSYLVDQRQCRVIVILNFDALTDEDKIEWERSKDKVFETELLYQPTLEKSIEVGMRGTEFEAWHPVVKESLKRLEIDNVRIVARAQRFVRQLISEMKAHELLTRVAGDAWDEIAKVSTLLAAAHASKGVGAPAVLEIVEAHSISLSKEEGADEGLTADQKKWKAKIDGYGMYFGDSLDKAIAQSVLDGFPRMDLLVPAALEWDQIREKHGRDQKFQQAWDRYHSSLKEDDEEVCRAFLEALPGVIATESVHNIEATGRLLRIMGHANDATELFNSWVDERRGERSEELLAESFFPGTVVTDPEFKELISRARENETVTSTPPLADALRELDSNSWSEEAIKSIAMATPEEIAEVLISENRNWRRCVRTLSAYAMQEDIGKNARTNFLLALHQIAATSPLNADRIRNKLGAMDLEEEIAGL